MIEFETLPAHQQRVVVEAYDLDVKLTALSKFTLTDFFKTVPAVEQNRLHRQLTAMKLYLDVLHERIADF